MKSLLYELVCRWVNMPFRELMILCTKYMFTFLAETEHLMFTLLAYVCWKVNLSNVFSSVASWTGITVCIGPKTVSCYKRKVNLDYSNPKVTNHIEGLILPSLYPYSVSLKKHINSWNIKGYGGGKLKIELQYGENSASTKTSIHI